MTQDTQTEPDVVVDATEGAESQAQPETEDILDIVDDLIVHLHEAKVMPLSSNVLVDRDAFLSRLEKIRASLPDELRAARWKGTRGVHRQDQRKGPRDRRQCPRGSRFPRR